MTTEPATEPAPAAEKNPPSEAQGAGKLQQVVDRISNRLRQEHFPAADRAALRRARPGDLGSPAFWKLAIEELEAPGLLSPNEGPQREEQERRWVRIVADLAELGPLHQARVPLGRALASADLGEARVIRLLRAEGDALLRLSRTVAHRLASQGQAVNAGDLAELVLSDGHPSWSARARRRVARDFYRTTPAPSENAATSS